MCKQHKFTFWKVRLCCNTCDRTLSFNVNPFAYSTDAVSSDVARRRKHVRHNVPTRCCHDDRSSKCVTDVISHNIHTLFNSQSLEVLETQMRFWSWFTVQVTQEHAGTLDVDFSENLTLQQPTANYFVAKSSLRQMKLLEDACRLFRPVYFVYKKGALIIGVRNWWRKCWSSTCAMYPVAWPEKRGLWWFYVQIKPRSPWQQKGFSRRTCFSTKMLIGGLIVQIYSLHSVHSSFKYPLNESKKKKMTECVSRSHGNLWSRCQVLWVLLDASQKGAGTKERFSGTKISTQMIWGPWSRTGHSTTLVKTKHRHLWGWWGTQETRGHVHLLGVGGD